MAQNNGSPSAKLNTRVGRQRKQLRRNVSGSTGVSRGRRPTSGSDPESTVARGYRTGRERGLTAIESIKSAGSQAIETVGEHAIPAALITVGLAWLLLENSGIRPHRLRVLKRGRDAMSEVGHTVFDAAGTAGHAIAKSASSMGASISEATTAIGEVTSSGYRTITSLWERHPVPMSAAVLSVGIVAGLLLPGTSRERSLMGEAATNVARKVRNKSSELVEDGRRLATTGVKAAAIVHKVKRIARTARKAVTG